MKRGEAILLSLTLALALALRLWSINWGMPFALHADEDNYLPGAVGMLMKGDWNPHYFHNPPLLTYLIALELMLYLGIGKLVGLLQSAADIGHQLLVAPDPLYALARGNSALLGTATVLLTYLAARRLLGTRTALLSGLLLAVAFLHVRDSHYAVNDVPATFLLMASFYFAARIFSSPVATGLAPRSVHGDGSPPSDEATRTPRGAATPTALFAEQGKRGLLPAPWGDYLLAGGFLGLGVATKYNVGLGAVPILAAHLLRFQETRPIRGPASHLPLAGAGLASLIAFLLANPYALLDWPAFLKGFGGQYGWTSDPFATSDLSTGLTMLRALSVGTSPAILGASVVGLLILALRQRREAMLLVSFPLAYSAFFLLGSSLFYARFAIPLVPFVAILAAHAAVKLIQWVRSSPWQVTVAVPAVALLAVPPLLLDVRHNSLLRAEDTRLLLGRWIEENVPPDSSLAVEGYSFVDTRGRRMGPKKLEYRLAILPSIRVHPLEHYRRENIGYLVVSSYAYGRYFLDPVAHADSIESYRRLERELPLVASFHPTADGRELPFLMDEEITPIYTVLERVRPGPTLKVYRVGEAPSYGVEWLKAELPETMPAGQRLSAPITLRNAGNLVWPADGYTPVRVGYRWLDATGKEVAGVDLHSPLPRQVAPGEEVAARVEIVAPSRPGDYTLRLDLVWENFAWFSAKGAQTWDVGMMVQQWRQ